MWTAFAVLAVTAAAAVAPRLQGAEPATVAERNPCALPPNAQNAAHPGMAWVPAGRFDFGDTVYAEEQPIRPTRVDGFWMDRTEVTNDEFAAFVKATGYLTVAERAPDPLVHPGLPPAMQSPGAVVFTMPTPAQLQGDATSWWRYVPGAQWRHPGGPATSIEGLGAYPVVAVTYEDAVAYAHWKGHALPTEAQWEWAARAARPEAKPEHEQPKAANTWQGLFPVKNTGEDGHVGLAPVGCYAPNALGLYDLIGNVWELTADRYQPTHDTPAEGPPDQVPAALRLGETVQRVIKGGSFLCAPNYCMRYRAGARQPQDEDLGASHVGFRTVLNAPGP